MSHAFPLLALVIRLSEEGVHTIDTWEFEELGIAVSAGWVGSPDRPLIRVAPDWLEVAKRIDAERRLGSGRGE